MRNTTILIVDDEHETLKGYEDFLSEGAPLASLFGKALEAPRLSVPELERLLSMTPIEY